MVYQTPEQQPKEPNAAEVPDMVRKERLGTLHAAYANIFMARANSVAPKLINASEPKEAENVSLSARGANINISFARQAVSQAVSEVSPHNVTGTEQPVQPQIEEFKDAEKATT